MGRTGATREERDAWQKKYRHRLEDIIRGITPVNITPAEMRMRRSIDLVVPGSSEKHWITRVRDGLNLRNPKGRAEYTIRGKLASGHRTELDRILAGEGDYFLYSWADENLEVIDIIGWYAMALDPWRKFYADAYTAAKREPFYNWNPSGDDASAVFYFRELPSGIIVAMELPPWAEPRHHRQGKLF